MSFQLRARALAEISCYIASHNPAAAIRWHDDMYRHFRNLGEMPGLGVPRESLRPELRLFPVSKYVILYRKIASGIEVVRVLHGARDLRKLL